MSISVTHKKIRKVALDGFSEVDDLVAIEEPMEIRLNYLENNIPTEKSVSVTMRTPGHDFELAAGFLFTEGILTQSTALEYITYCKQVSEESKENVIKVILKKETVVNLLSAERNFYITGSCGVCGKASIEAIEQQSCYPIDFDFKVYQQKLLGLVEQMKVKQVNFKYTGGIHACALYDEHGQLIIIREDIGRHNALDKLIGHYVIKNEMPLNKKILLLSGRISFELVQKASMAGISIVVAIGAPSSLAIETAEKTGITLIGFLKEKSMNIYSHPQRVIL
jgi:FdhD protein